MCQHPEHVETSKPSYGPTQLPHREIKISNAPPKNLRCNFCWQISLLNHYAIDFFFFFFSIFLLFVPRLLHYVLPVWFCGQIQVFQKMLARSYFSQKLLCI